MSDKIYLFDRHQLGKSKLKNQLEILGYDKKGRS